MRRAARIDTNHKDIVDGLRRYGASVLNISQLKNCFDILVGYKGITHIMEIKASEKHLLTDGELKFKEQWKGSNYNVITNLEQAIKIIEI